MKAAVAAALALCGAAAIIWSLQSGAVGQEPETARRVARSLGIVALVAGSLLMLNYLYALALVRRMLRGADVIGRWTVAPAALEKFRASERARKRPKNNWRVPRRAWPQGLPVVFSADAVVVGNTYFQLFAKGISRFTFARMENGPVPFIEFSMTLTVFGAGPQSRTARYRGHLRIPVAEGADVEAARVVSHFKQLIGG